MGDRAIAQIKTRDGSLYFYTHNWGASLPDQAREALRRAGSRRMDPSYALRIVVDQLIKFSGARDCEIGAGLMFHPKGEDEYNNDSPSVVIDMVGWTVETYGDHAERRYKE